MDNTYNGWKNWETWVSALWIDNEERNYRAKIRYFQYCKRLNTRPTYTGLISYCGLINLDCSFYNSRIRRREITEDLQADFDEWKRSNG